MQPALTHLIIISDGHDAGNQLISSVRAEGGAVHAAHAKTAAELAELLARDRWDLLVLFDCVALPLPDVLQQLKRNEQEMSVIAVTPDAGHADALALYRQGVQAAPPPDHSTHLLTAVMREAVRTTLARQLRQLDIQYRELETRHQLVLDGSAAAISYVLDGVHLYCNQQYAVSFGYDSVQAVATTPLLNLISPDDRIAVRALLTAPMAEEHRRTAVIRKQDGSEEMMQLRFTPVEYQGKPCLQLVVTQAAGNVEYADNVAMLGTRDLLTQLENKARLMSRLENAIRTAVQHGEFSSLLLVRINEFADISAAIGQSSANIVLNDIARFLTDLIDTPCAIARLEDHTFGILVYDGNPDDALALAGIIHDRINNRISAAMLPSLELSSAIGVALINSNALDAEAVVGRAWNNLRQMPADAGREYQFSIGDRLQEGAADVLAYLKLAVEQRQFRLLFQPLVHINGDSIKRYEVLVRMLDSTGNEVLPAAFLPVANLNDMGESIDRVVLDMALDAAGSSSKVQCLIVSLTTNTMMSQTFLPWLSENLRKRRMPADLLVLQLSEIEVHNNPEKVREFCQGLHQLNVRIALTRFGCALEPFKILEDLKPAFVKLDESLVRDIVYNRESRLNVEQTIRKLHAHGLLVVIPQVEEMDALPILWDTGADFVQGYCLQGPSDKMNYEFVQVEEITLSAAQS